MRFFKTVGNLSLIKNVDTSVTTQSSACLATLEPCIKVKVYTLLKASYTFMEIDMSSACILPACENKFVCRGSKKATVAKTVLCE